MKKVMAVMLTLVGLALLSYKVEAAAGVRGAKTVSGASYLTTPVLVSKVPSTVYSIILTTGAVTDYVVLFDSANYTAASATVNNTGGFRGKYHAASATANTQITFDPPLFFKNGITAINATALTASQIVFETGKAVSGY